MMMFAAGTRKPRIAAWLLLVAVLCLAHAPRDARAVVFEFEYADAGGVGFFDPALGAVRRAALEHAGAIWGSLIPSAYGGEIITVKVSYADLGAGTPRASTSTGSQYPAPTMANTHFPKALANHLSGMDVDPDKDEITIQFNSNLAANYWYYGLDGNPSATETDFVTTALHEIGHGLGFSGTIRQDGSYGVFGDGLFDPSEEVSGWPTIYDQFVTSGPNGPRILDLSRAQRMTALVSSNLYWNGAQATAANGSPVELFAPMAYSAGSTLSHVDPATVANALMQPARPAGVAIHVPLAVERAMLRDMGWDIAVAPTSLTWSGLGVDNSWSNAQNWVGGQAPQGGDSVAFGPSPQTDVAVRYTGSGNAAQPYMFLNTLSFAADAPAYTLRFKAQTDTRVNGTGIISFSSQAQTIYLESSLRDDSTSDYTAAKLTFSSTANAGSADYQLRGGGTTIGGIAPPHGTFYFDRHAGASVIFENNATAGTASFEIEGGSGDGGPNALVTFRGNATASAAEFRTKGGRVGPTLPVGFNVAGFGGQVRFEDSAKAGLATFHNEGQAEYFNGAGGFTVFTESSSAENSEIHNHGATYANGIGGATYFYDNSTAGAAHITNHADGTNYGSVSRTVFQNSSNAGTATIENLGSPSQAADPGLTEFRDSSSAAGATINNRGHITVGDLAGRTIFYDSATAANATIRTFDGYSDHGRIEFRNQTTAANSHLFLENEPLNTATTGGYLNFYDISTAAQAEIRIRTGNSGFGGVQFYNNATAASAQIITENGPGNIAFWGNSSAGNANFSLSEGSVMGFYDQSTAPNATITMANRAILQFTNNTSAGSSQIIAAGGSTYTAGAQAYINFQSTATAADSTIVVNGASASLASPALVYFNNGAHAGNASLIANGGINGGTGGEIRFYFAHGDTARLVVNAGAKFDLWGQSGPTSVGSIEGAGTFHLRGLELAVGTRNSSTTVSGPIVDTLVSPTYTGGRLTKVGTGTLTLAGTNTYTGLSTINAGTLSVTGSIAGGAVVNSGGTLSGTGTIGGTVTVNSGGVFAPGTSPGAIAVGGLAMMPGGTLNIELGDPTSDHIVVTGSGSVSLAGTLNITLLDGFTPALGDQFTLFTFGSYSGDFTNYTGAAFGGNLKLRPVFTPTSLRLSTRPEVDGDINLDGTVDIFDVNSVSDHWGTAGPAGDVNGDGAVDIFDINMISDNWGAMASASVPEPSALALSVFALVAAALFRRRGD